MDIKDTYTAVFLKQAEIEATEENIKKYKAQWWFNLRHKSAGGLRITDAGLEFLDNIGIRKYEVEFPLETKISPQLLVWLDHQSESPYHLGKKKITVFRERSAIELYMFSGDIQKMGYAKSLANKINSNLSTAQNP